MDFFYRQRPWYAGQFMRKITPKVLIPEYAKPFITTVLNWQKPTLLSVLVRNVDKVFRSIKIWLPISDNDEIDFGVMETLIRSIEEERLSTLVTYLSKNGLSDYKLSDHDIHAFSKFAAVKWEEFRIGDLFEKIKTKKLMYKAKDLPNEARENFVLPCLTSSFNNQGLNYYVPFDGATIIKNAITIPQNSDVYRAYYQSSEFTVLSDAYAIDWKYTPQRPTREQFLFMVMCINRVTDQPFYSHKNKLGGWNVVKDKRIVLPVVSGQIDYRYMHTLISAIEKLIIKDVVQYSEKRIAATSQVAKNRADS